MGKGRFFKYLRKALYCEPFSELSKIDAGFMPASIEGNLTKFWAISYSKPSPEPFCTNTVRTNKVQTIWITETAQSRTKLTH
jgi:hypothetical protein